MDFVDHRERGPATPAALDHLAVCPRCERDLTEVALTIAALRRVGHELGGVPVPEARPALILARSGPPQRRWAWRLELGGLVTGAAIAALLVVPHAGPAPIQPDAAPAAPPTATTVIWRDAEARLAVRPDLPPRSAVTTLPPRYPEGLTRPWKEVPTTDATPRALEPL